MHAPATLRGLVLQTSEVGGLFAQLLNDDLQWLESLLPCGFAATPELREQMSLLRTFSKTSWAAKVAKAIRASICVRIQMNCSYVLPMDHCLVEGRGSFNCDVCAKEFSTAAALAGHRAKVHGIKNPIRLHLTTTFCEACLLQVHSRERLVYHVKRNPRCADFCLHVPPVS